MCGCSAAGASIKRSQTISARGVSFPLWCVPAVGGVRAGSLLVGSGQRGVDVGGSGYSGADVQEWEVGCELKS
jgi:hypothetical protein